MSIPAFQGLLPPLFQMDHGLRTTRGSVFSRASRLSLCSAEYNVLFFNTQWMTIFPLFQRLGIARLDIRSPISLRPGFLFLELLTFTFSMSLRQGLCIVIILLCFEVISSPDCTRLPHLSFELPFQ